MQRVKHLGRTSDHRSLRTFSLLFSIWLLLLPQLVLLSQDRAATNGCEPVLQEEEVKHDPDAGSAQVHVLRVHVPMAGTRPSNEELHRSHHGEVPHLPPWC